MVTPYDGYVDVCEALAELTPGRPREEVGAVQLRRRGSRERREDRPVATGKDAVAVFDHAYHGRTNLTMAMTAKNMPYKNGFGPFAGEVYRAPMSYPFRETAGIKGEDAAERAIDYSRSRSGPPTSPAW